MGAAPVPVDVAEVTEEGDDDDNSPVNLHLAFNRARPEVLQVDQTAENLQKTAESFSVSVVFSQLYPE